ncbi:MAG: hypothetical protein ACK4YP_19795 [Myxococcota bacterium]
MALGVLLPFLLGCAQTVWLEEPADPTPPKPATIEEACALTTPAAVSFDVTFPARSAGCDWYDDGNLPPEQGVVTARVEETAAIDLDAGLAICDVAFDFRGPDGDQIMEYDDAFLLTFGDVVLAASYAPMVEAFDADGMLRLYDWADLAGFPFDFEDAGTYCLGAAEGLSACSVPPPETPGPIALSFGASVVNALAERAHDRGVYTFGFVTIGDNDADQDCSHAAFTFTVDVAHVPF